MSRCFIGPAFSRGLLRLCVLSGPGLFCRPPAYKVPNGFLLVRTLVLTLVLTGLAGLIAVRAVRGFVLNVLAGLVSVRGFVPDVLFGLIVVRGFALTVLAGLIVVRGFALTVPAGLVRKVFLCLLFPGIAQACIRQILLSLLVFFFCSCLICLRGYRLFSIKLFFLFLLFFLLLVQERNFFTAVLLLAVFQLELLCLSFTP